MGELVPDEKFIRGVLRQLARQSVALVLQPGNVPVVQNALVVSDDRTAAALLTCEIRGWIAKLHDAVPTAQLGPAGELPSGWERTAPIYRLTEAGWNAIHGTYEVAIRVLWVAVATLVATLVSIAVAIFT